MDEALSPEPRQQVVETLRAAVARLEEDLSVSQAFQRHLLAAIPEAIILTDERGLIVDVNQACLDLLGWRVPRASPVLFDGLLHSDSRDVPMRQRREASVLRSVPATVFLLDGRQVLLRTRPVRDPRRGQLFLVAITDTSERDRELRELDQARLKAVEGEQAKRMLLAMASHELRTPLQAIAATFDILGATKRDQSERDVFRLGEAALTALLREIDSLLAAARHDQNGHRPQILPFDPVVTASAALESAGLAGNGLVFAYELPVLGTIVAGDEIRLRQILINMLTHADVCGKTQQSSVLLRLTVMAVQPAQRTLRFEIDYRGTVLDDADRERLFQPFVRVSDAPTQGLGLGLAAARTLAGLIGARLGHVVREDGSQQLWLEMTCALREEDQQPLLSSSVGPTVAWILDQQVHHAVSVKQALSGFGLTCQRGASPAIILEQLLPDAQPMLIFVDQAMSSSSDLKVLAQLANQGHQIVELHAPASPFGLLPAANVPCLRPATPRRLLTVLEHVRQHGSKGDGPEVPHDADDRIWMRSQPLIDAMPEHVAITDRFGTIRAVNARWRAFAIDNGAPDNQAFLDYNYLEACWSACQDEGSGAGPVVQGLREILAGTRDSFTHEYPCHSEHEQRFFLLYAAPLRDRIGRPHGAVITHLNITKRIRKEQDQERIIGELRQQLSELLGRH